MRFLRASFFLSARAARRARASAAFRTATPTFAATVGLSQSLLASLNRQASSLNTAAAPASAATTDALKSGEALAEPAFGLSAALVEDSEDSESANSTTRHPPEPIPSNEIDSTVRTVVEGIVACDGEGAWRTIQLADPSLKFKIVNGSMKACRTKITNVDLTNILTVEDLLAVLHRRDGGDNDPFRNVDTVAKMFRERAAELPANMYFQPAAAKPSSKTKKPEA
ncbi:hypothetical protein HKX48_006436 [Thoreauomyces humboldtii]|nr:hypothetical protein HKX48_006436 [Thoreauomyces humboldtii]